MSQPVLNLFANCIPVKGQTRCTIFDLQRERFYYVPADLYQFIKNYNKKTAADIYAAYETYNHPAVEGYINFLLQHELAAWLPEEAARQLVGLPRDWRSPSHVSCLIITASKRNLKEVMQLQALCEYLAAETVVLYFDQPATVQEMQEWMECFTGSCVRSVQLIINFSGFEMAGNYTSLLRFTMLFNVHIYQAAEIKQTYLEEHQVLLEHFTDEYVANLLNYRASPERFRVNIPLFTEAQHFNTYFNSKLFIGSNGELSNAAHTPVFGKLERHMSCQRVLQIVQENDELWKISKAKIYGCKNCEFRYGCVDSRIPDASLLEETHLYRFPNSCGYNALRGTWAGEKNKNRATVET